ncbi:hypothetical protein WN51_07809 [Melipona quadrifasciata]|uniref:Uncharacterized protein n=1 Tax=Melipona quadrifasciata TaxID=166423 RepID=A0A0N0U6P3_9HYME|nr:hypothetical protein WN51_07809 [Melipona quadrifasciata]
MGKNATTVKSVQGNWCLVTGSGYNAVDSQKMKKKIDVESFPRALSLCDAIFCGECVSAVAKSAIALNFLPARVDSTRHSE